jgi:putative oxidoreductase
MFPNGLPGAGLLLLRLVCGVVIIAGGVTTIIEEPYKQIFFLQLIALAAALLLVVGLWTPVAGLFILLLELCMALLGTNGVENSVLLAVFGAALAALGPGCHSVDARLYGRKRIQIRND